MKNATFDPFGDLDRLTSQLSQYRPGPRFMPVDLYRDGDRYVMNADLPGIDPGSIDVDLDGKVLSIRARRTVGSPDGAGWISQERPAGTFHRQLTLGEGVDTEGISANYDNGVLSVVIPVSERAKPRKIEISGGGERTQISS
jgi:HSP20 family protein